MSHPTSLPVATTPLFDVNHSALGLYQRNDSPIESSGIAVPDINIDLGDWLACGNVYILNLQVQWNTRLSLSNILANEFPSNIIRSIRVFRGKNARSVGSENGRLVSGAGVVKNASLVVVDSLEGFESGKITAVLLRL